MSFDACSPAGDELAAPGGQRHHRLAVSHPTGKVWSTWLERLKQGDQTSYQLVGSSRRVGGRPAPVAEAHDEWQVADSHLETTPPCSDRPDAGDQSVAIPAAITSGNKAGPNSPRLPQALPAGRWPRPAPPALIRAGGAPTGYSAPAPERDVGFTPPKSSDGEGLQARRMMCMRQTIDYRSSTGSVNCSRRSRSTMRCIARRSIRRRQACAQRMRLHGHGGRCTSTIAPYAKQLVRPNDPTGGGRELRARMGRRHGNIMEVVGDVVAQLP
jgi:hypothetical protein